MSSLCGHIKISHGMTGCTHVSLTTRRKDVAAKRLLCMRTTFSQTLCRSVTIIGQGCLGLTLVDPAISVKEAYNDALRLQQLMPANTSGLWQEFFIFKNRVRYANISTLNARFQRWFRKICSRQTVATSIQLTQSLINTFIKNCAWKLD